VTRSQLIAGALRDSQIFFPPPFPRTGE
jgi:hypothetical protein